MMTNLEQIQLISETINFTTDLLQLHVTLYVSYISGE